MDFISITLLFLLTCIVVIHVLSHSKNKNNLPPGPSILSIMRNLVEISKRPQQSLANLAKIHGPIMHLKMGQLSTIVISSPSIAKEVLQTHDLLFSNRSIPQAVKVHNHENYCLPFLPISDLWKDYRKICNTQLFSSMTLDACHNLRTKKLQELLSDIHRSSLIGEEVDIGRLAFKTSMNFLSNTFFSLDFANSAGEAEGYKDIVMNVVKAIGTPNVVDFFPMLKMVDPQGIRKRSAINVLKLLDIFDGLISKRLKLREREEYITNNDMLDTLLNISQENGLRTDNEKIKHLFLDLIVAGTDTTSYTIERAMTELIHSPNTMKKAKHELEQIIGIGNPIEESNIPKLPYLQAIVKETLRLHPPAPLLLPRKAKTDVQLYGYTIPQGAQVLVNEWAIGRNSSIWDNPNLFSPDRFLGSKIDVRDRNYQFSPFGGGRRICPGLPLAIRMLHSTLGSLINSFDWKLANGMKEEDMDINQPLRAIPVRVQEFVTNFNELQVLEN